MLKDCEPVRGAVEGGMGIGGEEGRRQRMMIGLLLVNVFISTWGKIRLGY